MDRSPDADADPLTIARDAAHHMLDELAWMSLTASGIGAVVGSAVALTGWMMSPVIPLGVPGTLVVTGLVELALAPRTLSDSRRVGQVGALIWLAHCLILMVLSPPLIAFTLTSIGLLVGTIIGTTSAPPGAWRWGPIATTFWLGGLAAYLHLHAVDFANIPPLVAFPSLFLCGTAALVAGFTRRLHLNKLAMNDAMEDLARQREEADRANHAKSAFLASMSHELRTPLNAIIGYGELILDTTEDPETAEDVGRITHAGRHLLSLVNDVLDTAKIESGRMEIGAAPYRPADVLAEVRDVASGLASQRGIQLLWTVDDVPDVVVGDALKVRQILLNLLGNALKFTEAGEVELRTRANPGVWSIAVRDTGPGIDATTLAHLFEPFAQGQRRGLKAEGTGLGLSISKALAEAMGGRLEVHTQLGQGSVFEVLLPLGPLPSREKVERPEVG